MMSHTSRSKIRLRSAMILIFIVVLCFGCNPERSREGDKSKGDVSATPVPDPVCFLYVQGRDSIKLSFSREEEKVTGRLAFLFYEKDKSTGTIAGHFLGDTLLAHYTFTSEGMLSMREVAFLKHDDALVLGTGEILNSGSRDVFKDHHTIEFTGAVTLHLVPCP